MKWKALAGVAVAMALVVAPLTAGAASAHTGNFTASAACNETTGEYTITYEIDLKNVSGTNRPGSTMWRVGGDSFDGTPASAAGMDRGPIASVGSQKVVLGTVTLPGTTKSYGPWVYAYTTWDDDNGRAYGLGSDGRLTSKLKGDCAVKIPEQPKPKKDITSECTAAGYRTITEGLTPFVWDEQASEWVPGVREVTKSDTFYDVTCVEVVTPVPPVWVDDCGPGNGHWTFPAEPAGYRYHAYSIGSWRYVAILPSLLDGYVIKPGSQLLYVNKDSKVACEDGPQPVPVPATFNADPTDPDCGVAGALPEGLSAGEFERFTLAIEPGEVAGTFELTVTPKEGFFLTDLSDDWTEHEDGSATRVLTVQPAIAYQSADSEAPCYLAPPEEELIPGTIASQCVGSVPYLGYAVSLPEGVEPDSEPSATITFLHPTDPSQNYVVTGQPLSGTLLWPGASAGTPQQWPGWVLLADGTYAETDGNYAWTRAAAGITVRFDVNPSYETVVTYPPESALCANPASAPATPAALPATGGTDMTPWGIGAAVMLIAGAALIAARRRLARS